MASYHHFQHRRIFKGLHEREVHEVSENKTKVSGSYGPEILSFLYLDYSLEFINPLVPISRGNTLHCNHKDINASVI